MSVAAATAAAASAGKSALKSRVLHIIRHAESELNVACAHATAGYFEGITDLDAKLSPHGYEQCESLRHKINQEDENDPFCLRQAQLVITSPLSRSILTAQHSMDMREYPYKVKHEIAEQVENTTDIGHHKADLSVMYPQLEQEFRQLPDAWWWQHPERKMGEMNGSGIIDGSIGNGIGSGGSNGDGDNGYYLAGSPASEEGGLHTAPRSYLSSEFRDATVPAEDEGSAIRGVNGSAISGVSAMDGVSGVNGINGINGISGISGVNAVNGANGVTVACPQTDAKILVEHRGRTPASEPKHNVRLRSLNFIKWLYSNEMLEEHLDWDNVAAFSHACTIRELECLLMTINNEMNDQQAIEWGNDDTIRNNTQQMTYKLPRNKEDIDWRLLDYRVEQAKAVQNHADMHQA